jgi:hypothetical protein
MHKQIVWLGLFILLIQSALAQKNDKQLTDATLSKAKIEGHIRFLASDEMRGRNTPSPEQLIAAKYLATQLQGMGVKAFSDYPNYMQPVKMKSQSKPKIVSLNYEGKNFIFGENTILLDGGDIAQVAEGIYLGYGMTEDFNNNDVKGKIVFVHAGEENESNPQKWYMKGLEKRKMAAEKGAIALIEFFNNQQFPWRMLVNYFSNGSIQLDNSAEGNTAIPHIWMRDENWTENKFWSEKKKLRSQVKVELGDVKKINAYNIVGYIEGTDPKLKNEYVVYSAHYDHVGVDQADEKGDTIYNGARDNAVGTASVLMAAENLAMYPPKRSAMFVFFTGEEKGLLGSEWFVERCPVTMKNIIYNFNSDNAGYNDTSIAMIIGLGRTTGDVVIQKACEAFGLKAIDDPAPEQNLFDRSDNVNFAKKGVPAPTYSLGLKAFDAEINKYYHQPSDQPDNLDYNYLFKFFGAYVYASRIFANNPTRPFWKTGDKYYEAGVKLYK